MARYGTALHYPGLVHIVDETFEPTSKDIGLALCGKKIVIHGLPAPSRICETCTRKKEKAE